MEVAICTPQRSVSTALTSLLGIMSILYVPFELSVPRSQAETPGLVNPCPLWEMKRAASWCMVTIEPVDVSFTSLETESA